MISRRTFLGYSFILTTGSAIDYSHYFQAKQIMSVRGPLKPEEIGQTLIHEHFLVDFVGAAAYDPNKWNDDDVIKKLQPYLEEVKKLGCKTIVECTPNYLGRDVQLLERISSLTGLNVITNTGYYGGSVNKYLPAHAFTETEKQLADRWIAEFRNGIDGTSIKPGFIKISVNETSLSEISRKLIRAAGFCHLATGLTIASHTGPATPAFEEIEMLKQIGVAPDAFIWVHAQNEKEWHKYLLAIKLGAWVSLDALRSENVGDYVEMLIFLKKQNALHRVLVSHDAGWYEPHKPNGGTVRGYTTLFEKLVPQLETNGFTRKDLHQLLVKNPATAFTLQVKKVSR